MVLGSLRDKFRADAATCHVPMTVTRHSVASLRVRFNIKTCLLNLPRAKQKGGEDCYRRRPGTWGLFSGPEETAFIRGKLSKIQKNQKSG